ncbi:MAG TPA: response regulator transcription factor [Candidatus Paceibacterota bacterium]|nr:response regulator transcription factor [Verrucomicrobiota bacterium]HRY51203.1 response regulator transcription factor [Candidatus Paceibacterota bacterium]HSA02952.1 response regulator transcription factor [Candidatus Paceibacterota bacterium]
MMPQENSSSPLRILIADDHPLFRQGLRFAIETRPGFRVICEEGNGSSALRSIRELQPDLCILDISMPGLDGLEVVRQMRAQRLQCEVVLLTMYKEEDLFDIAMDLEVKGYVLKESAVSDIFDAIRSVMSGHRYISPTLGDFLVRRRNDAELLRARKPGLDRLTPAERRILRLIAEDKTSKEIAAELGLSPRTVENHRTNICDKLDVHGVHGLVKFAFENKSRLK